MEFRKDVEGLRAVAVLPILLFHAGITQFSGGFIGVDIFFVISGFLITRIIVTDIGLGRFSLARFYARRAVRILPPLCVVLIVSFALASTLLYPSSKRDLAESALATILFVSNIYFWRNVDYFRPESEYTPLLHTWSLGIEEQFYIFYPILLIVIFRNIKLFRSPRSIVLALTVISFGISLWLSMTGKERTAFYVLPSRAWELGIGALVALDAVPRLKGRRLAEAACVAALALIAISLLVIESNFSFPAPWALAPCLATATLIAYAPGTYVATMLSTPVLRSIGGVSYALYLWHWPVIVFYRIYRGYHFTAADIAVVIVASLAAAYLSTLFFERPMIRRFREADHRLIFGGAAVAIISVASTGVILQSHPGSLQDYPPDIAKVIAFDDYQNTRDYAAQFRAGECFIATLDRPAQPDCTKLDGSKPNVVLAGDSLAAQYWRAYQDRFPQYNVIQATAPSCRPTIRPTGTKLCQASVHDVLDRLVPSGKVKTVILGGSWKFDDLPDLRLAISHIQKHGVRVILIGPSLTYDASYPTALADAIKHDNADMLESLRDKNSLPLRHEMERLARDLGVDFVSPIDIFCNGGKCPRFAADGTPSHFDSVHLTLAASRDVVAGFPEP